MIYSASRRTDMPAFRPDLIVNRIARSRKLDGVVLWTKDVRNFVRHFGLASVVTAVPAIINFTVTGLAGTAWEPRVPTLEDQVGELEELGRRLPRGAIRWRFDPIVATEDWRDRFVRVKTILENALGGIDSVTVSFPDPYRKAVERVKNAGLAWPGVAEGEKRTILEWMVGRFPAGAEARVRLCCEPDMLGIPGVGMARCVDSEVFDALYGTRLGDLGKDAGQRAACGCMKSTEIGSYEMACGHGCLYCYARPE